MAESKPESARKEWRRPELRKLPIAATAGQTQKEVGNEGGGEGKGDSGKTRVS